MDSKVTNHPQHGNETKTQAGNYFVSNYPPYSFWTADHVGEAFAALERTPTPNTPLGVYLHIPFCRKRCRFCYFKVYTDKDANEIENYLKAATRELELYSSKRFIGERKPTFIYFGGGTPSFISSRQLMGLTDRMKELLSWDAAEEITFECEPGTLTENKLRVIREIGVTRLSLGIENFNDHILEINGRAHGSKEIDRSYHFARSIGFQQINIDLIAGMVGETTHNWTDCVRKTIALSPDSVTIYQMEIPFNTTIFKEMKAGGETVAPVADWETKREWVKHAFAQLERAGYHVGSAYTAVKDPSRTRFLYRDLLWSGADLIGLGVASFSHIGGTHFQNQHDWTPYVTQLEEGRLPIYRALTPSHEERMIREFVLQMKLGHVSREYFRAKFGIDPQERFAQSLGKLQSQGFLEVDNGSLRLNREALLQVDKLLHEFFLPQHRNARYA
ncbi:MAG: coproporphyrinogen III oxidase family protein [Acidobacteria bacterium]|nr:coproporphyrinogen III oxidase family protein [Acidobacteriota bacterium]MCI0719466.1 coproporphyrinogen III oxidase family protein [Acidobacteriota bacterium]